jgi:hypothetical protein
MRSPFYRAARLSGAVESSHSRRNRRSMLVPHHTSRNIRPWPAQLAVDCRPVRLRPTIVHRGRRPVPGSRSRSPRGRLAAILRSSKPAVLAERSTAPVVPVHRLVAITGIGGRLPSPRRIAIIGRAQLQPVTRRASSRARIAIFRRNRASRSYRSIANNRFASCGRIIANFSGPCGVEVKNFVRAAKDRQPFRGLA